METVNSLSGGKTSSYIAMNYPADIEIFALCCIDCHNAGKNIDKVMKQRVNDKLQKYVPDQPEFVATSEDPKILKVMFDLEQMIGREIVWVRGVGWEQMLNMKKAIPNMSKRFCTSVLKMQPIFEYLYRNTDFPVKMRIGYRWDEMERANGFDPTFTYASMCQFREKSVSWINRWQTINWRVGEFPLIEDRISHDKIVNYWKHQGILDFPEDSNCLNCFWKQPHQLRKNFDTNNAIMQWAKIQEELSVMFRKNHDKYYTFKDDYSLRQIEKMNLQLDFFFGTGSGCQAGFCTD